MKKIIVVTILIVLGCTGFSSPTKASGTLELPDIVNTYLEDPEINSLSTFNNKSNDWSLGTGAILYDGMMQLGGVASWSGWIGYNKKIQEKEGFILSYKFNQKTDFAILLHDGQWWTDGYKRFGLDPTLLQTNSFLGKTGIFNYFPTNFQAKPDIWYTILMAVDAGGDFLAVIWEKDNPLRFARYREVMKQWANMSWNLGFSADKGSIKFDDFYSVSFRKYK